MSEMEESPFIVPKKVIVAVLLVSALIVYKAVNGDRALVDNGPFSTPVQVELSDERGLPAPKGYDIFATDEYTIDALIMSRETYSMDRGAELSPVDLALAWGPLTREPNLHGIKYSQSGRWYYYTWGGDSIDIPPSEIPKNSANTHIIPSFDDPDVKDAVMKLRKGDAVRLSGYLVKVEAKDGWHWRSSRKRTDTGDGSCEVFYVMSVDLL